MMLKTLKNTVGELIGDPAPASSKLTPKQVSKIRILDPACGSGSFLLGAYEWLLDWHRDWYVADGKEKHREKIYEGPGGWRLATAEKKRILLNNIYGVDIDLQAVEVTKLSLLLKVLEGESKDTLESQMKFFHERALPDLAENIKCGNSLIGTDFYEGRQLEMFTEEEQFKVNAFSWENSFPQNGMFDAVIGNPPWGADFSEVELEYLRGRYRRVIARTVDSYIYFLDQAFRLVKKDGYFGFIIPSTVLNQVDAKPVRQLILDRGISALVSLGQDIFTTKVLNTSTILASPPKPRKRFVLQNVSHLPLAEREMAIKVSDLVDWQEWQEIVRRDHHLTFFVGEASATAAFDRMRTKHPPLTASIEGKIHRGVTPDVVGAHIVSRSDAELLELEEAILRPSVSGGKIKRYREWSSDQHIIYTTRSLDMTEYPKALAHLKKFRHLNTCPEVADGTHPWWRLHRPRKVEIFRSPKIIGLTTTKTIELIYDPSASLYVTDAMYLFHLLPNCDHKAVMALMQSSAFLFMYRVSNQGESRVIPQIKASKLEVDPILWTIFAKL